MLRNVPDALRHVGSCGFLLRGNPRL